VLVVAARERYPGYWGFPLWQHEYSSQHRNLAVVSSHPDDIGFQNLVPAPHDGMHCHRRFGMKMCSDGILCQFCFGTRIEFLGGSSDAGNVCVVLSLSVIIDSYESLLKTSNLQNGLLSCVRFFSSTDVRTPKSRFVTLLPQF
jgi:hypothetical protein